jgi:hypothetical protein
MAPVRERGETVIASDRMLRWLCWALVVLVVISAVVTLLFAFGYLRPGHDAGDLVATLLENRQSDVEALPFVIVGSLATLGIYLIAALLGLQLREWVQRTPARDVLTLVLVVAGVVGIVSQVLNIAVGSAAGPFYCDCGYKNEEVISLNAALNVGWTMVDWLAIAATTFVGIGIALAGRLVAVSSMWRTLSLAIAALLLLAVFIRILGSLAFIAAFDPFQISDLIVAGTSAILVPIWAILLARDAPQLAGAAS